MTTIPSLSDVTDILDTDQVMVTNAQGQSYKIAGSELNKRHKVIIASSTTVTGAPLRAGWPVRIYFTADITAANATTTMQINYNNVNYYVKVPKNGALANYVAFNLGGSPAVFKYVQAYTTLELLFDGTQFIIMCNPVVISGTNFSIYADGLKRVDEVTENGTDLVTSHAVAAAIDKVKDIMGSLPTDAVLHYSFDEVPDYPDGTADVRLINNNTFDIQSTNYRFSPNTFSTTANDNGKLKVSTNTNINNQWFVYMPTQPLNKIVKIRFTITNIDANTNVNIRNGYDSIIGVFNEVGTYEIAFVSNSTAQYPSIYFYVNGGLVTLVFDKIYIGDGSYSTPIIDNTNGQNNAYSNGGIATKGLSGKGLLGLGRKNIVTNSTLPKPTDKSSITLSIWVKYTDSYNDTGTRNLFGIGSYNGAFCIYQEFPVSQSNMRVTAFVRQDTTHLKSLGVNVARNEWHNAVMVWENKTLTFYVDGKKYTTSALDISDFTFGGTFWRIGDTAVVQGNEPSVMGTIEYYVDDAQIFDRALTDNEVMALYLNKANTPKYYPPAQLPS